MKKILIVNTVGYNYDGMTSVILNYLSAMEREDLKFYFCVYENINPMLKEELERLGETVVIPNRKLNLKEYVFALQRILKNSFDIIHVHGNSGTMLIEVLIARLRGVRKVIIHGHTTNTNYPIVHKILKPLLIHLADKRIACSKAAGEWLYGSHPYTVLNNAIDVSRFCFSEKSRDKYRKEFGVETELVIGHVGHFSYSKNHDFLIDVFQQIHQIEPNSKLLLLGDGTLFDEVQKKTKRLGLQDSVIFAGRRNDVADIYSAMDVFVFPSFYEGLGMVMVEAQASGMECIASDSIPHEAAVSSHVQFLRLSESKEFWAEKILQISDYDRAERSRSTAERISACGYDISREADKLRAIYYQA